MRMYPKIKFAVFSVLAGLTLVACHKSSSDSSSNITPAATPTGVLWFHLHTNVDTSEVDSLGKEYTLAFGANAGRKIVVTQAQLLISNIQLIGKDGSVYNVPNSIIHKVQSTEPYLIGNVPIGNYVSVKYQIGLDTTTNSKIPTSKDTELYDPTLWFTSNASSVPSSGGYVFLDFEGQIDTSSSSNITKMAPFSYRIGTTAHLAQIALPSTEPFSITANNTQYVHMVINYAALFDGLSLNNPANLSIRNKADNSLPLASTIVKNMTVGGGAANTILHQF